MAYANQKLRDPAFQAAAARLSLWGCAAVHIADCLNVTVTQAHVLIRRGRNRLQLRKIDRRRAA